MGERRSAEPTWALDREIVLSRLYDAPRELVFRAWTEVEHFAKWFGPSGFTTTVRAADMRVGGLLQFDMVAPDGTVFDNRIAFLEIAAPERIVFDHGHDRDDDPDRFRVTLTFDARSATQTVFTLRQLHPSAERRKTVIGFGGVELGYQTLEKLAVHLRTQT